MFEVGNQASLMSVQYKEPESDLPILSQTSAWKNLALRNLFVPVATTLKELSSLMGSRVGVKRWKDFAFFQATNQSDSLRQVITSLSTLQRSARIAIHVYLLLLQYYSNCNNNHPKKSENSLLTNSMTCIDTVHKALFVFQLGLAYLICLESKGCCLTCCRCQSSSACGIVSRRRQIYKAESGVYQQWGGKDSSFRVSEASKNLDWYKLGVDVDGLFWLCGRWLTCWAVPSSLEFVVHRPSLNLRQKSGDLRLIRPFALAAPLSSSTGENRWEVARTHGYSYKLSPEACRF